ncbi:Uncharacterized conserved protein [Slackia heliotrinireducens]|uniref:Phytoene dehydrogenase-like oxidoreductase n=1 Tax=Slackia heliotrinireducens (strain ATCC 29202 / DSM 20476 / NCTC 11029 / RHS 1) TaxID=471855 RepID=C7N2W1_SLAHD|nr:NAD(P)/FAD-dependent oxidoreductase [Slackia heliotrinireducens]ACV21482.1 phytoene dehydrogenase-like oxidoreductase [Slackia heliotrinireducens DSM 20476]VEG98921.1 Uncharacterized conserved protein [Slackia heliotrinireducens]
MSNKYDVIVAGGGHNGLITAAYLAKAGKKVLVVEGQEHAGGGLRTEEVAAPGFKSNLAAVSHGFIQPNPLIRNDELGLLSKFGLEYIYPEKQTAVIFPDDRSLIFYRDVDKTCESIAQFSEHDAEAYHKFYAMAEKALEMMVAGMYNGPTPTFGAFYAGLEGSEEGRDLLRIQLGSSDAFVNEWFEDDHTKVACNRFTSEGMFDPREQGSGMNLLIFVPLTHKYGTAIPKGGSIELTNSIIRCIEANGGEIRTNSWIKEFKVANGTCEGVVLEDGEVLLASDAVVTNFNIKQLDETMLGKGNVSDRYLTSVKNLRPQSYQNMLQSIALNEAPMYKAGEDASTSFMVEFASDTMEGFYREFDAYKYGEPWFTSPLSVTSTLWDPSLAPEGKHSLYLYSYQPYELKGGAQRWDEGMKEEVAGKVLEFIQSRATNMGPENIVGQYTMCPRDFERWNPSWIGGNFSHIGCYLNQNYGNRPFPEVQDNRLPLDHMYICGPSAFPGGGVIGGGRAVAQVVMEDLGIDFFDVVG